MREIFGYKVPEKVFEHMAAGNPDLAVKRFTNYRLRMDVEFKKLREYVFVDTMVSLDIGCGIGGVDIELAKMGVGIVHLLDGDGTGVRENGLKGAGKPWGDVTLAQDFVAANVKKSCCVKSHYPWVPFVDAVDVVVSLKSWGHHYPIETYLDLVKRALPIGGRVITDIRNGTNGSKVLQKNGFNLIAQCDETRKCKRLVFVKVSP